jgi:ribosomal protein L11 methyltransferase
MAVYVVTARVPARRAQDISDRAWGLEGVQGIEEAPADGGALFQVRPEHEFLEFGSEAAKRCAEWLETDEYRGAGHLILRVYMEAEQAPDAQVWGAQLSKEAEILSIEKAPDTDYLEEYRKRVRGQNVGEKLWVGPPWDQPPGGREAFFVDPGLAFGTGDHPTTQMCLARLEQYREGGAKPARVLDLGTGTGVLAVACRRFFPASEIFATDLDPLCKNEVEKTLGLNGMPLSALQGRFGPEGTAQRLADAGLAFDLLISNIYAEVLRGLLPDLGRVARPGTRWLVSGILNEGADLLIRPALASGWALDWREAREVERPSLSPAAGLATERETWHALEFRRL